MQEYSTPFVGEAELRALWLDWTCPKEMIYVKQLIKSMDLNITLIAKYNQGQPQRSKGPG
jgi:hypothetical protein